jgi:hypothetical protein
MEINFNINYIVLILSFNFYSQNVKIDTLKSNLSLNTFNNLEYINNSLKNEDLCTQDGKLNKKNSDNIKSNIENSEVLNTFLISVKNNRNKSIIENSILTRYSKYCNTNQLFYDTILIEFVFLDEKDAKKWKNTLEKQKKINIKKQNDNGHFVWTNFNWLIICKENKLYWLLIDSEDFNNRIRNLFEININKIQ